MSETLYMCPHCGWTYIPMLSSYWLVPYHDYEGKPCPGSVQNPRNARSDRRPLWKDQEVTHE